MSKETYYIHGSWNAICEMCGFQRKSAELQERWDGKMVCRKTVNPGCWEPRHPQDMVKSIRGEQAIPWSKPESTDTFVEAVCTVSGRQAISDFAVSDCAISDTDFGYRDA